MRVLVCTVPEAVVRLRSVLNDAELHVAHNTEQALRSLQVRTFDLAVIGMLFDESRGLELLRRIRADPRLKPPPIVGVRGGKTPKPVPPDLFDLPMWAMGACDVVDFVAIPSTEAGNGSIRERLLRCAAGTQPGTNGAYVRDP